ncbi:hypothetical protein G7Y89_g6514 [Cudoniella acicularis]|uniref:G domain-containing protein n=1 Tax=Cudoniella acicularis TaxID=354080 RepID=A0A8H4W2X9_9HELO|nr:hypothetical protein G7Y89_g6514 [Cudoniella acicularis]
MAAKASASHSGSMDNEYVGSSKPRQPYTFLKDGTLMPSKDTVLIAVMGVTGSGKSQFINKLKAARITKDGDEDRKYAKIGNSLASETRNLEFFHLTVDKHDIILVDTPGFNDKDRSDTEILQKIATWLMDTGMKQRFLSGICYMHRINETRFDKTANENLIMLYRLCGPDGIGNVKLVTSMWDLSRSNDELEATFVAREQELREVHWSELLEEGATTMRTHNDFNSVLACVKSIIGSVRKPLALQNQIINEKRPLALTDIGKRVMENARTFESELASKLGELEQLEEQLRLEHKTLSRPLIRQREELKNNLVAARRQQKELENWTWSDAAKGLLVTAGSTVGSLEGTALVGIGAETGLTALGFEGAAAILGSAALPILGAGAMVGGAAGAVWWYRKWKKRKDDAAEKVRQIERERIAEESEAQKAENEAKQKAEQKQAELYDQYEYRMRLAHDVLMERWYTRVPNDPQVLKDVLERTLPTNSLDSNQHLVVCGWEFSGFCQALMPQNSTLSKEQLQSSIEQTVVIVGSDPYFQTTTIASYLETKWGKKGSKILQIAIEAVYHGMKENRESGLPLVGSWPSDLLCPSALRLYVYNPHVLLQLSTENEDCNILEENNDSIQALLWLCQAARVQSGDSMSPEMSLRQEPITDSNDQIKQPRVSFYPLRRMEAINSETPGFCWAGLFKKVVVAESVIDREWKEAKGLEISYELMVKLSAVETAVEIVAEEAYKSQLDGDDSWAGSLLQESADLANISASDSSQQGLILVGFFTALIPIRHHQDTIQWHLEYRDPEDKALRTIDPQGLKSIATRDSWFRTQDLDLIKSQKCILGWWNEANVILGTESLRNDVRFGKRDSIRKWTSRVKGTNSTLQLGASGLIPINASATISLERISNIQRFDPAALYLVALDRASLHTALIYDTSSHQAWLVPKLSLLLHMCHSYIKTYQDPSIDPIPFVQPSANPSKDIKRALQGAADIPVCVGSNGTYPLSALLVSLNASLINSTLTEESITRTFFRSTKLLGRQYMDIIEEPPRGVGLTVVNVPDGYNAWKGLVEAVDSVLICANLGQAIQPKGIASCACKKIPEGRGLLVAHFWCLERILARRGNGESLRSLMTNSVDVTQGCSWKLQGNPFLDCSSQGVHGSPWEDEDAPLQNISARRRLPYARRSIYLQPDLAPSFKTYEVVFDLELLGMALTNHHQAIFLLAHLYSGVRQVGLLAQASPEMDYPIAEQMSLFFAGVLPTTKNECASRFSLPLGFKSRSFGGNSFMQQRDCIEEGISPVPWDILNIYLHKSPSTTGHWIFVRLLDASTWVRGQPAPVLGNKQRSDRGLKLKYHFWYEHEPGWAAFVGGFRETPEEVTPIADFGDAHNTHCALGEPVETGGMAGGMLLGWWRKRLSSVSAVFPTEIDCFNISAVMLQLLAASYFLQVVLRMSRANRVGCPELTTHLSTNLSSHTFQFWNVAYEAASLTGTYCLKESRKRDLVPAQMKWSGIVAYYGLGLRSMSYFIIPGTKRVFDPDCFNEILVRKDNLDSSHRSDGCDACRKKRPKPTHSAPLREIDVQQAVQGPRWDSLDGFLALENSFHPISQTPELARDRNHLRSDFCFPFHLTEPSHSEKLGNLATFHHVPGITINNLAIPSLYQLAPTFSQDFALPEEPDNLSRKLGNFLDQTPITTPLPDRYTRGLLRVTESGRHFPNSDMGIDSWEIVGNPWSNTSATPRVFQNSPQYHLHGAQSAPTGGNNDEQNFIPLFDTIPEAPNERFPVHQVQHEIIPSDWSLLESEVGYESGFDNACFLAPNVSTACWPTFDDQSVHTHNGTVESKSMTDFSLGSVTMNASSASPEARLDTVSAEDFWSSDTYLQVTTNDSASSGFQDSPEWEILDSNSLQPKRTQSRSSKCGNKSNTIKWGPGNSSENESHNSKDLMKKPKAGRRNGSLPASTAEKARNMRRIRACLPCWLLKVPCTDGNPCNRCKTLTKLSMGRLVCTRQHLEDYLEVFFPDIFSAKFNTISIEKLSGQLSKRFIENHFEVGVTCGRGYPAMKLKISEFVPETDESVPFICSGDVLFAQRYPAPIALQLFDIKSLLETCRRHSADMAKYNRDLSSNNATVDLSQKIMGTISQFYSTISPNRNTPLLDKAMMLYTAMYFLGRTITYSSDPVTEILPYLRRPAIREWDSSPISHLLNRQLKSAMHLLIRELIRDVLEDLERELRTRSKTVWGMSFCVVLILCFCMEDTQKNATGTVMHKRQFGTGERIPSSAEAIEVCRKLDDLPFEHLKTLFHGVYRSQKHPTSKKKDHIFNPIRDGLKEGQDESLDQDSVDLIYKFRDLIKHHTPELVNRARPPSFDSAHESLEQFLEFYDKNSARLVSKFLLSF